MVYRLLIVFLTVLSGFLFLVSACLVVWYLMHGAYLPAVLQLAAGLITFAGVQVGIRWMREN